MSEREAPLGRHWLIVGAASAAWLAPLLWLHASSTRLLPSWHGFVHGAIATRFPSETLVPENPFFAGEPLPYYWFYHWLGHVVASLLGVDALAAFRIVALASLVALVAIAAWIGRTRLGSLPAGLLIGYLAVVGVNPLGPGIAAWRHVFDGWDLINPVTEQQLADTVFVSDRAANAYMTHRLLGAMHIGRDWQFGTNLVWFVDVSGRTPALALVMGMALLLTRRRPGGRERAAMGLTAAGVTALDPLMGLALIGAIGGGCGLRVLWGVARRQTGEVASLIGTAAACGAGAVLALPTYHHILLLNQDTASLSSPDRMLFQSAAIAVHFVALLPLAWLGSRRRDVDADLDLWVVRLAGTALTVIVPFVYLKTGVEHDLSNAGQCLLAVPAVFGLRALADALRVPRRWLALAAVALCLPTAIGTLAAYVGRPPLPLRSSSGQLHRLPADHPLERLYAWVRASTARDAVFVYDVRRCVKMTNNVAELPAFTGRTLFTDQTTYLIDSYPDLARREEISLRLSEGGAPTPADRAYLERLGRPVYLVSYEADVPQRIDALVTRHGPPAFSDGFVAVFRIVR